MGAKKAPMKQAQFNSRRKSIEEQIEDEIRILKTLIDAMGPCLQGIPANQNNTMSKAFNDCARSAWKRYMTDLPRRIGLQRLMDYQRRRLCGLRTAPQQALT